jgi:hypothetical protein
MATALTYLEQKAREEQGSGPFSTIIERELGPETLAQWTGSAPAAATATTTPEFVFPQIAATQPFDISSVLQSLGLISPQVAQQVGGAGLLAPYGFEPGADEPARMVVDEHGVPRPLGGGYDPETPVGFGKGRPSTWGNEMLEARRAQLQAAIDSYNNPIKIGGVSIRPPVQTAWNWGAGLLGISDEDQLREIDAEQQARMVLGLEEEDRMQQGQVSDVPAYDENIDWVEGMFDQ